MYKVNRFYSEPQDKTTVQLEFKSVDTSDYEYYVKSLNGDLRDMSDEEVTKRVLDTVRVKLNPNDAIASLDEKMQELDALIVQAEESILMSQMAVLELTELVFGLIEGIPGVTEPDEPEEPRDPNMSYPPEPNQLPEEKEGDA